MAGNHKMIQVLMRICATLWDEKRVIVDNRFCYISCYVYIYIISRNISYSSSCGTMNICCSYTSLKDESYNYQNCNAESIFVNF